MFYHPIHQLLSGRSLHYEPCQMVHGAGIAFCKKGTRVVIVCCWCMPEFDIIFCYFLCICGWECKGFPKSKTCWQDSMKALRPSGLCQAVKYNEKPTRWYMQHQCRLGYANTSCYCCDHTLSETLFLNTHNSSIHTCISIICASQASNS